MKIQKLLLAGSLSAIFFACSTTDESPQLEVNLQPLIIGKSSVITLETNKTIIHIKDFVLETERIDSITNSAGLSQSVNGDMLELVGNMSDQLGVLKFWNGGIAEAVLLKKSNKSQFELTYEGDAEVVQVKGDFNAWNPGATVLEPSPSGKFSASIDLNAGNYQYLFVIDGKEIRDLNNPDSVDNGMGGWNSYISLPRPDRAKLPILKTVGTSPEIQLSYTNKPDEVIAFWNNYHLPKSNIQVDEDNIKITIPKVAQNVARSQLRIWAYNTIGASNEVLIPLDKGEVVTKVEQLNRNDYEAMIMYFLMVDRFKNGNSENDAPLDDPNVHPKANYFGGDLAGVNQKIDEGYFEWLGVNTVWLSPITQNPSTAFGKYPNPETTFSAYHGYWPISSTKVDNHFGTSEDMHSLVNKAHSKNMNVVLDYVANHVHEQHPVYQNNKDWATDLYLPDGTLNTERWDDHRLTTWFDTFLPTLDLSRPEVVNPMTDSALYWAREYNIDGFRHDATKHIDLLFWRTLTKKMKQDMLSGNADWVFQIGETYGSRELINSYINTGMLDGQFDFNVYDDAVATFARPEVPFSRLTSSVKESMAYYGDHNLMGYITGNQDRARFISYADGSVKFDEDAKLAGWTREINVQDTLAYRKLSALTAFMMTIPGIPVIYYGDEYGSAGGNDPDNRRQMKFDNLNTQEAATRERARKIINLRKNNLALIYGDFEIIHETEKALAISRSYFDNTVISVFNKSDQPISIELPLNGGSSNFYGSVDNKQVTLPANSFDIITFN